MPQTPRGRVALVTLGCSRNEVDSEELAGRLTADGWSVVDDAARADVALVNTCGFVEAAKKDSIDALLEAADLKSGRTKAVVAVGCLAERYGQTLAEALPEADAVLGFDAYPALSGHLQTLLEGGSVPSHRPRDRRRLLPLSPVARQQAPAGVVPPGHASGQGDAAGPGPAYRPPGTRIVRERLDARPWAPLKIASGCDRRCAFCAIPAFRGSFVSRPPADILAEARWLAERGVREVFLVSENSTSYGKDLGDAGSARGAAAGARSARRDRQGARLLSAARRDPTWLVGGDGADRGGGPLLRHLVPARVGSAAAPDAPLR